MSVFLIIISLFLLAFSAPLVWQVLEQRKMIKQMLESEDIKLDTVPSLYSLVAGGKFGLAIVYHPTIFFRLRKFLPLLILVKETKESGIVEAFKLARDYFAYLLSPGRIKEKFGFDYKSLRKIVDNDLGELPSDDRSLATLRKGR